MPADIFEHEGIQFSFRTEHDADHEAPWDAEDGHGPVSEWKRHAFGMGSKPPKKPGEMILVCDRGSYRTYDFAEAVKIAKRDGWDAEPYGGTKGQKAHRAAMADFDRLRRWCNDQWDYVGVIIEMLDDAGDPMGETESLWGVESDAGDYFEEVAQELAAEIIHRVERPLKRA